MADDPSSLGSKQLAIIGEQLGRVATRNAVTPMQWILGICAVAFAPGLLFAPWPLNAWCFAAVCTAGASAIGSYLWLLFTDKDRLQTEEYRLETRKLDVQLLGDETHKEDMKVINAEPVANSHPQVIAGPSTTAEIISK